MHHYFVKQIYKILIFKVKIFLDKIYIVYFKVAFIFPLIIIKNTSFNEIPLNKNNLFYFFTSSKATELKRKLRLKLKHSQQL